MVSTTFAAAPRVARFAPLALTALTAMAVTAVAPSTAMASGIVFENWNGSTFSAAWLPANQPPATSVGPRYWDQRSYDSVANTPTGACTAGTLVNATACDWGGDPRIPAPPQTLTNPGAADPNQLLQYFGITNPLPGMSDQPLNFYFTGAFDFDWTVLFQLSDWNDTVEFGWYGAGDPTDLHPIIGPGGPFTDNLTWRAIGSGPAPDRPFGFYYRNTRYDVANPITFYTQSRFNNLGSYYGYFSDPESGLQGTRTDDEMTFLASIDERMFQQFVMFNQGNRYWIGLEDQIGRVNPQFCVQAPDQPCSDYDFNDLILHFHDRPVPEPGALTLLAGGLFGLAWAQRRRRR